MSSNDNLFIKDPQAKVDFGFDWSIWLNSGDELAGSSWLCDPLGLSLISSSFTPILSSLVVASGTIGATYALTNHIVTLDGLEDERTLYISIQNR